MTQKITPTEQLENYAITQGVARDARKIKAEFRRLDELIAELVEAAVSAHDLLERVGDSRKDREIIDALAAAIAKVRGEQA